MDARTTHIVNTSTLAPDLRIRTFRSLPFTGPQPGFNLGGELLMRDFGLSVKYGFKLEGDVMCQQSDGQVCGCAYRFLHDVNSLLGVCKTNDLPTPHRLLLP
jgi:hypothetical protein